MDGALLKVQTCMNLLCLHNGPEKHLKKQHPGQSHAHLICTARETQHHTRGSKRKWLWDDFKLNTHLKPEFFTTVTQI